MGQYSTGADNSLLGLQAAQVTDPGTLAILQDSQNRVRSMALIHQTLYQSANFARVDFSDVLQTLTRGLAVSYGIDPDRISLRLDTQPVLISIESAIPLGLVVNELVSNALKHAYPNGRTGEILVRFETELNSVSGLDGVLLVSDDGVGIDPHFDIGGSATLGLQLVQLLCEQLHGKLKIHHAQPTYFKLLFPIDGAK